MKSMQGSDVNF